LPINSTQVYIKNLLNGLAMPGNVPNLVAYITPPNPNVQAQYPTVYVWPLSGNESRNPARGGTVPRALYTGAGSGTKPISHVMHAWLVWDMANDDSTADISFPGMVDAIMAALRVSTDAVEVADPYTSATSWLIDVGEDMTYQITVRALEDQAMSRYDALLVLPIIELIAS
jgi:hypothetical protein